MDINVDNLMDELEDEDLYPLISYKVGRRDDKTHCWRFWNDDFEDYSEAVDWAKTLSTKLNYAVVFIEELRPRSIVTGDKVYSVVKELDRIQIENEQDEERRNQKN
jgi:hypothetical protein